MSRDALLLPLAVALLLFFGGGGAGYALAASGDPAAQTLMDTVKEGVFAQVADDAPLMLAAKIFLNNLQACAILFLGGATFGLLTFFILFSNGLVVGIFVNEVVDTLGPLGLAVGIVPHGIFELPAIFISGALGLALARALVAELTGRGDAVAEATRMGGQFLRIVVPLLVVAAVIEAFITPALLHMVI
ncbi:stage II sporulation protein M [Methanofollis formosanus]|uniref:Stage II sporulation protein M n=1 Tax=Methanofollis formosanus TaxID=299308 RepID=A0A8G1A0G8_9EURY|nr:stage II sporulation protein M [Methanofollis formosanus]QYZ78785.1 stage II sporulation protein M [Methanofollis formosanus]